MKPKLYQYAACPFCNKVRSLLEYKGVDFETIEVHPLKKSEISFSPEYRAVPIYIDSKGVQVNDSTPIMRHIDAEFPERRVFVQNPADPADEIKWLAWSEKFVKGLPTAIYDTFGNALASFDYITKVGKFSAFEKFKIKYLGAFVMSLVAKKIKKREGIDRPEDFLKEKAAEWAGGLNGRPFMGGDKPNASDLAVFGITRVVWDLKAGNILRTNTLFKDWYGRLMTMTAGNASRYQQSLKNTAGILSGQNGSGDIQKLREEWR